MVESGCGTRYVPVDVSESAVEQCARRLAAQYDGLEIHGLVGDFELHMDRIPPAPGRRLVAFLGGTIGNLDEPDRARLLKALRAQLGPMTACSWAPTWSRTGPSWKRRTTTPRE